MVFQNILHLPHGHHRFLVHFILPLLHPLLLLHFIRHFHQLLERLQHQNQLHFQIEHFLHLQFRMRLIHHLNLQIQTRTRFIVQFKLILLIQFMRIFLSFIQQVPFYGQVSLLLSFLLILLLVYFILLLKFSMLFSFLLQVWLVFFTLIFLLFCDLLQARFFCQLLLRN